MKNVVLALLLAGSFTGVHALDLDPAQTLILPVSADGRFDFDNMDIPAGVALRFAAWDDATGPRPLLDFHVTGDTRISGDVAASFYDLAFNSGGNFNLEPGASLRVQDGGALSIATTGNGQIQLHGQIRVGRDRIVGGSGPLNADNGRSAISLTSLRNAGGALIVAGNTLPPPEMDFFGSSRAAGDDIRRISGDILHSNAHPVLMIQQPVPEAGTWSMLLAGLGMVGLTAHRRQRNRTAVLR